MVISKIIATNFLGLREAEVDLGSAPVSLFAGPNGAGKSSLREAIRFLLLGTTPRVDRKGDFERLISWGAKRAKVSGVVDGHDLSRNVRDGKPGPGVWPEMPDVPTVFEIATGATSFSRLNAADRRRVLFEALGVNFKSGPVLKRLEARGVSAPMLERVAALLRSGFDAAVDQAKGKASQCRGAWTGLTGENWGSAKASEWEPNLPRRPTPGDLSTARAALQEAETALAAAHVANGEERGRLRQDLAADREAVRLMNEALGQSEWLEQRTGEVQRELDQIRTELLALPETVGTILHDDPVACPGCKASLWVAGRVDGDALAEVRLTTTLEDPSAKGDQARRTLLARREALENEEVRTLAPKRVLIARTSAPATDPLSLQATLDRIETGEARLKELETGIEAENKAKTARLTAAQALTALEQVEAQHVGKADLIAKAAGYAEEAEAWDLIAKALLPTGIPGEILAEHLAPLNAALEESALAAGWPVVKVSTEIQIERGDALFGLMSESEQWRADALIAAELAARSRVGFLTFDRLDVLDVPNRIGFAKWAKFLTERRGISQVFAFGTFKEPPALPAAFAEVFWVAPGGAIERVQAGAAPVKVPEPTSVPAAPSADKPF